ncbi:MAG: nuclear transport factor 2 family protein [Actinomycetota bacterium]|nr:nuclear transport factor 2 family protein [Acidimicrobiia bacterium]MDQ3294801.1 nuclear transport factor 2 family protein [Actinomycetota bacterium]
MGAAADELEIRNVVALLAHLADDGAMDDYVDLYTVDAVWDMPGAPRKGHDAIRAGAEARRATGEAGPGSATRHAVSTIAVALDGDSAVARSTWLFFGDTTGTPTLRLMGTYRDTFVRTGEGWRVARREITIG